MFHIFTDCRIGFNWRNRQSADSWNRIWALIKSWPPARGASHELRIANWQNIFARGIGVGANESRKFVDRVKRDPSVSKWKGRMNEQASERVNDRQTATRQETEGAAAGWQPLVATSSIIRLLYVLILIPFVKKSDPTSSAAVSFCPQLMQRHAIRANLINSEVFLQNTIHDRATVSLPYV